jgi:enoyl-CoA hydratase/carnithine racemase
LVVLEVGLGGRLDATTCHPDRGVVGFGSIGLDHSEFLGPTAAAIAAEKAGVLQRGCTALSAAQSPEVAAVLQERATACGAELRWVDPLDLGHPGLRRRSKPMVVAVQGITFTLGLELMLAADMVVAADNCRFAQLEVKRGIMPTGGATIRMAQRAGWGNAMRYLLTGDEFDSATALRLNWVQQVVPAGQQLTQAMAWAENIATQAPLAVVATRQNALQALELGPAAAVQSLSDTQQFLSRSADATEGVRAFVEKRPPRFSGT